MSHPEVTFDNLEQLYRRAANRPFWVLYGGRGKMNRKGDYLVEDANIDTGFEELVGLLEYLPDGIYTLETRASPNNSKSPVLLPFRKGEGTETQVAKVGNVQTMPSYAQYGAIGQIGITEMHRWQDKAESLERENRKLQQEKMQLEFEKKLAEQSINGAPTSTSERVWGIIENNFETLINAFQGKPVTVGRLDAANNVEITDEELNNVFAENPNFFSHDLLLNTYHSIQSKIKGHNFLQILIMLNEKLDKEPLKVMTAIQTIMK